MTFNLSFVAREDPVLVKEDQVKQLNASKVWLVGTKIRKEASQENW